MLLLISKEIQDGDSTKITYKSTPSHLHYNSAPLLIEISIVLTEEKTWTKVEFFMEIANQIGESNNYMVDHLQGTFTNSFTHFPLFVTEWVISGKNMFWYETRQRIRETYWKRNFTVDDPKPEAILSNNRLPTIKEEYFYEDDDSGNQVDLNRTCAPKKVKSMLDWERQSGMRSFLSPVRSKGTSKFQSKHSAL